MVVGESFDYLGDIDEFTFDGVAGDSVTLRVSSFPSFGAVRPVGEMLSPTGAVVTSIVDINGTPNFSPRVMLPVTGTYLIRLRNYSDQYGSGVYDLLVN